MSYTINLTNGNLFATIADGTINTGATVGGTVPLTLVGKNYAGYGQFLDDNFIHLLENGANPTQPSAPLTGQLWYNTTTKTLSVYNGTAFKTLAVSTVAAANASPTNNNVGDLWWDSTNSQLNAYAGNAWTLVGPSYSSNVGLTGAIAATITDSGSASKTIVELYAGDSLVGIVSASPTFTPQTAISGFATIKPGIQLTTAIAGASFQGIATNSEALNGLPYTSFMLTGSNTATSGTITVNSATNPTAILNGGGSAVGNIGTASIPFNTVYSVAASLNNVLNAGASATGNIGSTALPFASLYTSSAVLNGIVNAGASATGNIGSSAKPFNTIFAQATSAQYADVAERFAADAVYEAGTVVELGGTAEVTKSTTELSDRVFGVISTQAAYLMNNGAGTNETHPPVAMTGRVPVKVTGIVHKGDRLVSAGNGIARAAQPGEATAFNVIGRALVNKLDAGLGTVEAIVATK